jgi:hypothetical protein
MARQRSGRRHVRCTGRVAKYSAGIGAGVLQILLVFSEISRLTWIWVNWALPIPEVRWVYPIAVRIPHLIVDVVGAILGAFVVHPGVPHRADQLPRRNRITYRHMPRVGMQDLVKKAVLISYGYSPDIALPSVFHHPVYRRAQGRIT